MTRLGRIANSILSASIVLAACGGSAPGAVEPASPTDQPSETTSSVLPTLDSPRNPHNVLLIILDDLGVDSAACYAGDADVAAMPHLAALCDSALVFDRVWSNPTCSPTRATMLTGRYGFRTGIGQPVTPADVGLRSSEFTLPMVLADEGIPSANIGKWHLSGTDAASTETHPNDAGYAHYAGSPSGALRDYESWRRVVNGSGARETGYATTVTVTDALDWIDQQTGPWFAWVAFNAPHEPLHLPPAALHTRHDLTGSDADIAQNPRAYFEAMVEALDTEIFRLLSSIDPDAFAETIVIIVGDNGTAGQVASGLEQGRTKGSVYEGGIHVPMIVAGPDVTAGRTDALVNLVDVFPTVLDLMAVESDTVIDGVSFSAVLAGGPGARTTLYSEIFGDGPGGDAVATVSDGRWKYIRFESGAEELYDLETDPLESESLIGSTDGAANAALVDLRDRLDHVSD